jgi:hypothetical protein
LMHVEGHNHSFMHFLASKHFLGRFWAPPLLKRGYGARYREALRRDRRGLPADDAGGV